MKGTKAKKNNALSFLIIVTLFFTGCDNQNTENSSLIANTSLPVETENEEFIAIPVPDSTISSENAVLVFRPDDIASSAMDELTDKQRNSISMLNYLTMFTQEINASKNSRMFLESAYSSLLNNTYPNAVDQDTHYQLTEILDRLEEFRMNAIKRERLEYIYEQNRAQAVRSAVPNPMGLLSAVRSFNWVELAASVVYMTVDSITSYQNATSQADLQYLQDGWALDDAEDSTLHRMRTSAFSYMLDMVNTYNLPGDLALNESSIQNFVNWKMDTNVVRRIQLLEANKDIYQGFAPYWLTLADSYYQNGNYQKCIDAIQSYESVSTRIFRQDFELAKVLPVALLSAMEVQEGDEYIDTASHYLELLESNSAYDDWALRYFAAQEYIDLYQRTANDTYMNKAYALILNNVTVLVSDQIKQNESYLTDVVKVTIPDGASKEKRVEIEKLNKQADKDRKVALPPVSEPLVINCDLLFALATQLQIPTVEQEKIDSILHDNDQPLFLIPALDKMYWFNAENESAADTVDLGFDGKTLTIPALYVSDNATIEMIVSTEDGDSSFDDWIVAKVERTVKEDINSFIVSYTSESLKAHDMKNGSRIHIEIWARPIPEIAPLIIEYTAEEHKKMGLFPYLTYTRINE